MSAEWPLLWRDWLTPEMALDGWRERIARVETEETTHLASLPYIQGLAVVGSVGRGSHWPLSDIDIFTVAQTPEEDDPEDLVRAEEEQRNERLHDRRIPNSIESAGLLVTLKELIAAVDADDDCFLRHLDHPHWVSIVIKTPGARVVRDLDGYVRRFLERCHAIVFSDRFVRLSVRRVINGEGRVLETARDCAGRGEWETASSHILSTVDEGLTEGLYAAWRMLPQSSSRSVSRFLRAAKAAGEPEMAEHFLIASRLHEDDVKRRFEALPFAGKRDRDLLLAIRQGAGEEIDELDATRDLLHIGSRLARSRYSGPYPPWVGAVDHEATVRAQLEAALVMLRRLQEADA